MPPSGWRRVAATVALLAVGLSILLTAFALPSLHLSPHQVPIAVAGTSPATAELSAELARQQPDAFSVIEVAGADQAHALILDREVYGAVVVGPDGPSVLVASAASPMVARLLGELATTLSQAQGTPVPVEDVRPLPPDDPTGAGLAAGALPLVLGGWIAAALLLVLIRGATRQAGGAFGFAVVGALAMTAVQQFWFGSLDGSYLLTSAAVALSIAATAWAILGLRSALGNPGLGLGAVLLILLGNPLSGLTSAPELLPAGWGTLGQLLPPGAGATLLRSTAFFDGAGAGRPVLVLSCWLVAGVGLFVVGQLREHRRSAAPAGDCDTDAEGSAREFARPAAISRTSSPEWGLPGGSGYSTGRAQSA
jgi:hypothetical protein